jgi:hypothetical protein
MTIFARKTDRTTDTGSIGRRAFLGGSAASALLLLPACQSFGGFSLTEAVRRMLLLSSERAFVRLLSPDGYWDQQIAGIGFGEMLGSRGNVLTSILTSTIFKNRLANALADVAVEGSYRAAPIVTEAVRTIGIANAVALINGGPTAATSYLRGEMGMALVDAMLPEVTDALRLAEDPLVGQALNALTGIDLAGAARSFSGRLDDAIWLEMGVEESAIRADPRSTNDPVIMGAFGIGNAF